VIAIVQYNAGNITSVKNAVERLGYACKVTGDSREILSAEKVIFPGVGEAGSAMTFLRERGLDETVRSLTQPAMGICLGLQLMCRRSEEGNTQCLGIFDTEVKRFPATDIVPHIGWNDLDVERNPLFAGFAGDVYFVHSYYAAICPETIARCNYILPFSAAIQKGNFYATQFHPEKSGGAGERILKNFLELNTR
jgi:glutamine amidotransferase